MRDTAEAGAATSEHESILRFPTQLCVVTLALTLASFGWVVWNAYASYRNSAADRSRDLRVEELRGVILRLDEVLTMSARMAAATGDVIWETRYHQSEPGWRSLSLANACCGTTTRLAIIVTSATSKRHIRSQLRATPGGFLG